MKSDNLRPFGELLSLNTPFYTPQSSRRAETDANTPTRESTDILSLRLGDPLHSIQGRQNSITQQPPVNGNIMMFNPLGVTGTILGSTTSLVQPSTKKKSNSSSKPHKQHEKKTLAILGLQKEVADLKKLLRMSLEYNSLFAAELMKVHGITNEEPFHALKKMLNSKNWESLGTEVTSTNKTPETTNK